MWYCVYILQVEDRRQQPNAAGTARNRTEPQGRSKWRAKPGAASEPQGRSKWPAKPQAAQSHKGARNAEGTQSRGARDGSAAQSHKALEMARALYYNIYESTR